MVIDGDYRSHVDTAGIPFDADHRVALDSDEDVLARPPGLPDRHWEAEACWTVKDGYVHDPDGVNVTSQAVAAIEAETMRRAGDGLVRTPLGTYFDGDATEAEAHEFLARCAAEGAAIEAAKTGVSPRSRDRFRDTPVHDRRRTMPGVVTHLGDGVHGTRCSNHACQPSVRLANVADPAASMSSLAFDARITPASSDGASKATTPNGLPFA